MLALFSAFLFRWSGAGSENECVVLVRKMSVWVYDETGRLEIVKATTHEEIETLIAKVMKTSCCSYFLCNNRDTVYVHCTGRGTFNAAATARIVSFGGCLSVKVFGPAVFTRARRRWPNLFEPM